MGEGVSQSHFFGLIAIIDLHIAQGRETLGTHRQILANVIGADVRIIVIPGAPAIGALAHLTDQRTVFGGDPLRQFGQQRLPVSPFQADQRLALPVLASRQQAIFAVHQDLQAAIRVEAKLAAKTVTTGKGEQQPTLVMLHQQQVMNCVIAIIVRDAIDA